MDYCIGSILDLGIRLWDCAANCMVYVHDLEENVSSLRNAMDELRNLSRDVKRRVDFAENQNSQCTNQVKGWLESVEAMEEGMDQILQRGNQEVQNRCLGNCPKNYCSSYKLGKLVAKKLEEVTKLTSKGHFEVVADKLPRASVDEMPIGKTVGLEKTFREVWRCIQEASVGIIGLYGMGGVGKTTLLKRINNEFLGTSNDFDVVIWVEASKDADVKKLQEAFPNKLQIPEDIWKNYEELDRTVEIYKILRNKKFVLLLDNVWKRFDLLKVGVPLPDSHNGSKVIFTTRSEEVCGHMEANKSIKVECLEQDRALDLFLEKVGQEALNSHPDIPNLAKVVAEECKGLPLALITIGRSMASRKKLEDWERAIEVLRSYPSQFSGIVDFVYLLLEFSYDSLPNATLQSCFLYCSLFPKGSNIRKDGLINLWIGEGFLDEFDDIHDARRQGEEIIGTLKLACLLESGESEEYVKMHDVIREMALWLACERGHKKNKFLVKESVRPTGRLDKWKDAERISLWGREIRNLPEVLLCPKLITLLISGTLVRSFPFELFEATHALRVLNLSGNVSLTVLPEGIDNLENLQYLDLSRTDLRALPVEMKNLKLLKCLLLNDTYNLSDIPREVISSLSSLQVFSILQRPSQMQRCPQYDERILLEELECLEHIDDLCITIFDSLSVQKLCGSKLQRCIRNLIVVWSFRPLNLSTSSLSRMEHLESVEIWNCDPLKVYPENQRVTSSFARQIRNSTIRGHEQMRNLRILVIVQSEMLEMNCLVYTPCLQTLRVIYCSSIEEVLSNDLGDDPGREKVNVFSCLTTLHLQGLPKLKSVSLQAFPFPFLKEIDVLDCPNLKKLPLDFNSGKESLMEIRGEKDWWDKLHWDDEATKNVFSSKFKSLDGIDSGSQESLPTLSLPLDFLTLPSFPPQNL
ncbi:hypothetical protein UlMin_016355 [Ulmus minor]